MTESAPLDEAIHFTSRLINADPSVYNGEQEPLGKRFSDEAKRAVGETKEAKPILIHAIFKFTQTVSAAVPQSSNLGLGGTSASPRSTLDQADVTINKFVPMWKPFTALGSSLSDDEKSKFPLEFRGLEFGSEQQSLAIGCELGDGSVVVLDLSGCSSEQDLQKRVLTDAFDTSVSRNSAARNVWHRNDLKEALQKRQNDIDKLRQQIAAADKKSSVDTVARLVATSAQKAIADTKDATGRESNARASIAWKKTQFVPICYHALDGKYVRLHTTAAVLIEPLIGDNNLLEHKSRMLCSPFQGVVFSDDIDFFHRVTESTSDRFSDRRCTLVDSNSPLNPNNINITRTLIENMQDEQALSDVELGIQTCFGHAMFVLQDSKTSDVYVTTHLRMTPARVNLKTETPKRTWAYDDGVFIFSELHDENKDLTLFNIYWVPIDQPLNNEGELEVTGEREPTVPLNPPFF